MDIRLKYERFSIPTQPKRSIPAPSRNPGRSTDPEKLMNPLETLSNRIGHAGPNLGVVALVFTILFTAGLFPITIFDARTGHSLAYA